MSKRLVGQEAINHARHHNLLLSSYTSPTEDARDGDLSPDDAAKIAREDPSLIYLDVQELFTGMRELGDDLYSVKLEGDGESMVGLARDILDFFGENP
jgi:hypothetical protein